MKEWNLNKLYKSFSDEEFIKDFNELSVIHDILNTYREQHDQKSLENYLIDLATYHKLLEKISNFINLNISVDTTNLEALKYSDQLDELLSSFTSEEVLNQAWVASYNLEEIESDIIKEHLYIINEIKENQKHILDKEQESIVSHMRNTGSTAFIKLKDQVISSININIDDKTYPLTEVLNMAYHKDKDVRKKAYEAEIASYKNVEQTIAACLNGIKGEVLYTTKLRNYQSELERCLISSRMSKKTLDVLLESIENNLPIFRNYLKIKANHLGYTNGLPWYDLYAPVVEDNTNYDYQVGGEFVVKQFNSFSSNLGDFASKAIDNDWIDVYPRTGKVGGAFCCNIHSIKESRFLLNYGNNFGDVITLAHELGHGFHGECLKDESILNSDYPMPIAETASTFCETIVSKAALKEADDKTKLGLLEDSLSGASQVIVDIYSRFLFEKRFFQRRQEGSLSVEEIKELMLQAQKDAYGDSIDPNYFHPYMWTWKPHYYDADFSYYNFPYAFGLLLAKGLYALYLERGESFSDDYEAFLAKTGKNDLEVVCQSLNIDLQDPNFWQTSLDTFKEDIELYKTLLETTK